VNDVSTEQNKRIVRRFYQELWNEGKLESADELFAPEFVGHAPGNTGTKGPEGVKQFVATWRAAMPDLQLTIDQQYAEGDMVGTVFTGTGTQTGPLMGIPPTGKSVTVKGMAIQHLTNGQVVSDWGEFDILGLLQQLGVAPSGPGAPTR
jgi:steroid delta-isomerase-like uncharacterized protein